MKIRSLLVLPVLALGCLGLTGCDSKVGTAAVVGNQRISESDVSRYLGPTQTDAGTSRALSLEWQIREKLFLAAFAKAGGTPTDRELAALHDTAVSSVIGQQASGSAGDQTLQGLVSSSGLKPTFAATVIRAFELEIAYAKKINATQEAAVLADLVKQKIGVSVNPRFGSWNTATFAFASLGKKQLPGPLTLNATLPADVKAPAGQ
ncbi:MAG: hypothetical protein ABI140_21480 [Jatrophihabitantaceae bacterium]